jgi:hypothetical protein
MKRRILLQFTISLLLLTACAPVAVTGGDPRSMSDLQPFIQVADQSIVEDSVIIPVVYSDGPGWVVIHSNVASTPGAIIGYAPVSDGENIGVEVAIDPLSATKVLYAMLYTDTGLVGEFEFPGEDKPVMVEDKEVLESFMVDYSINISDFY